MRHLFFVLGCAFIALLSSASSAQSQGKNQKDSTSVSSVAKDAFGDPLPVGAIARIGTVRYRTAERHMNFQPVLSADGKALAMTGFNDEIDIIQLPGWIKTRTIKSRDLAKKNPPFFQSAVFSQDGKKLVASDANSGQAYLIDIVNGKLLKKFGQAKKDRGGVSTLALSRDEKTLVISARNDRGKMPTSEFQVWDVEKDKLRHTIEAPMNNFDGRQTAPTISADGRWLVLATALQTPNPRNPDRLDTHIEFWDLSTGKSERKIEIDTPMVFTTLSPDGKWLAASNGNSVLRFYEFATGKEVHNIRMRRSAVSHVVFAPDSSTLYVADYSGTVSRYDPVRGERIGETKAPVPMANVRHIGFADDGNVFALAHNNDALHYWDVRTGKVLSPTGVPAGMIDTLVFSPQGELFVASEDGHTAWWNPKSMVKMRDLKLELEGAMNEIFIDGPGGPPFGPRGGNPYRREIAGMLNMSSDGNFITAGEGGTVGIYDAKTGKLLYDDDARNGRVGGVCFLDGGKKLASIQQKKIRIWNTASGRDFSHFESPLRPMEFMIRMTATSPGDHFAFSTGNEQGQGRVLLWNISKKEALREWATQDSGNAILFSADDQWLAVGASRDQVRLTNMARPKGDYTLQLGKRTDEVTTLAFSPDSRQLACATVVPSRNYDSGRIVIFEVASKKVRLELPGHQGGIIVRLAYSHDAALLASGASDTTALVWNAGLRAYISKQAEKDATPEELAESFKVLAGADAKAAFQHMIKLVQTPSSTVKMLADKIAPAQKPDSGEKTVPQWINDLASNQFLVRNRASAALVKIGAATEPHLKDALQKARDVETKRRIEALVEQFAAHEWTADEVRHARAVEVAEAIASPEARAALTRWASGDAGAILTQQARQALTRLR